MLSTRTLLGCLASAIAVGGCSGHRVDLVETGKVKLDVQKTGSPHVARASIQQEGEQVFISGRVANVRSRRAAGGHVGIQVVRSDGGTLQQLHVPFKSIRSLRSTYYRGGGFFAKLSIDLPEGTLVRVEYHPGRASGCQRSGTSSSMSASVSTELLLSA